MATKKDTEKQVRRAPQDHQHATYHAQRPRHISPPGGIKSRERVQSLAEVFTDVREVQLMLDTIDDAFRDFRTTFLEPACGNGNFLEEIAARKLSCVLSHAETQDQFEFWTAQAVSSMYGIDISKENIIQAGERLMELVRHTYSVAHPVWKPQRNFYATIEEILRTNLIHGDALSDAETIVFVEYKPIAWLQFERDYFYLSEIENAEHADSEPQAFKTSPAAHYLDMV